MTAVKSKLPSVVTPQATHRYFNEIHANIILKSLCFCKLTIFDHKKGCTELTPDKETIIVFSTLGGGLTAIDPITKQIRWTIADGRYLNRYVYNYQFLFSI